MENQVKEEFLNVIIDMFNENEDITFVLSNELAFDVVELLELKGIKFNEVEPFTFNEIKEMFNSDKLIVSKATFDKSVEYWFEDAYGINKLKTIGMKGFPVIIEEDLLTDEEIEKYIEGEVCILCESEEVDALDLLVEETTNIIFDYLDNDEFCLEHCLDEQFYTAYSMGYQKALKDALDQLTL
ncbi:MAG: hypothetical protein RSC24_06725 [Clostridium sp.]